MTSLLIGHLSLEVESKLLRVGEEALVVESRSGSDVVVDCPGGDERGLGDGDVADGVLDDGGVDGVDGLDLGREVLGGGGCEAGPEPVLVGDVVVGQDAAVGQDVSANAQRIILMQYNINAKKIIWFLTYS